MTEERVALLNWFGARLAGDLGFMIPSSGEIPDFHPLSGELTAVLEGRPASLPYPGASEMMWATLAPTSDELRRTVEDLRSWVLPSYGWEARPAVVASAVTGQIGEALLAQSPQGYFRWRSRFDQTAIVVARLAKLREVVAGAPSRIFQIRPTVEALRRRFTVALATGDFDDAGAAINEIDQRQLDTATNALSMRIRLLSRFGYDRAIVEHPQLDDLLATRLTRRVADSVITAHHNLLMAPHEEAGDLEAALGAYNQVHDRLVGLIEDQQIGADLTLVRTAAYRAVISNDLAKLARLATLFPGDAIVRALRSRASDRSETDDTLEGQPVADVAMESSASHTVDAEHRTKPNHSTASDWANVPRWVAQGETQRLSAFLQEVDQDPDACDPGDGEFVLSLFTDSDIATDTTKARTAEQVLTTVIDVYVCEDQFPRRERLPFYQALLDVWSAAREMSSDAKDGQLLITLGDALLRLDGGFEKSVAMALGGWWRARPVRSRLVWLSEAIDLLTGHSINKDYLALWYAGAALIKQDSHGQTFDDLLLWRRLGGRLGLEADVVEQALGRYADAAEVLVDPLEAAGYTKIAIVSLHERPAAEAAAQIRERTSADVIVVVEHAAGEATASAATADVILFVWGANKHAVYRAFDKVRDRLEYVQGTGSASIVRALARRAGTQH